MVATRCHHPEHLPSRNKRSATNTTMGNTVSEDSGHPLALVAVAQKLRIQRFQVVILRETFAVMADENGYVTKVQFKQALKRAKIRAKKGIEILELLFTMWDHGGLQVIPAKRFCLGLCPLACSRDDVVSILRFTLHVCDDKNCGKCTPKDVHDILCAIDMTASYLGDSHLKADEIDSVCESVFEKVPLEVSHEFIARKLQSNPYIKRFVSGKSRSRVKFKEELTVVTEYVEKPAWSLERDGTNEWTSPVAAVLDQVIKDNFWLRNRASLFQTATATESLFDAASESSRTFDSECEACETDESDTSTADAPSVYSFATAAPANVLGSSSTVATLNQFITT